MLVPIQAAVLSAWGILNTDLRLELTRGLLQSGAADPRPACAEMEAEGRARLAWFDGPIHVRTQRRHAVWRTSLEIAVPFDGLDVDAPDLPDRLADAFPARHEALFTYALRDRAPVLVSARTSVLGALPALPARAAIQDRIGGVTHRQVFLDGIRSVPVHAFAGLAADQCLSGPAIVESDTTTVLLRVGDTARFDRRGWLEIAPG